MEIKLIKTEADYKAALAEIESLFDAEPDTPESDTLEVWVTLVDAYEEKHYQIPLPDPISAIEYHMESRGLSRKDLEPYIGSRARVSEILNRKRALTLRMIRNLEKGLGISAAILVQEYELAQDDRLATTEEAALQSYTEWASHPHNSICTSSSLSTCNLAGSYDDNDGRIPAPDWMIPERYKQIVQNTAA